LSGQIGEELGKSARGAADSISEKGQKLGQSKGFQTLSQTASAVKKEIDESSMHALVYKTPVKLRRRKEVPEDMEGRVVEPNLDATGVELHKDSK
jgi:import inner membrane translocase subunit TIM44